MHIRCMNILRAINRKFHSFARCEHPDLAGSNPLGEFLPAFVLLILVRHADTNTPLEDPFKQVCEALNSYVQSEGRVKNERMAKLKQV